MEGQSKDAKIFSYSDMAIRVVVSAIRNAKRKPSSILCSNNCIYRGGDIGFFFFNFHVKYYYNDNSSNHLSPIGRIDRVNTGSMKEDGRKD